MRENQADPQADARGSKASALALLVGGLAADDADNALAANDLALVAHGLHRRANLHTDSCSRLTAVAQISRRGDRSSRQLPAALRVDNSLRGAGGRLGLCPRRRSPR